jgi:Protein of unknown function (DUF3396)
MERLSLISLTLPSSTPAGTLTQLGDATMRALPLWWGTAGYALRQISGRPDIVGRDMAALSRRYWCAQIMDTTALQWDGLEGLPGINWLTWLSEEFAHSKATNLNDLSTAASAELAQGVFHRLTPHGLSLAAGPSPIQGDINTGEDIRPYIRVSQMLRPLKLAEMTPLAGPLGRPDVLSAWLNRFEAPAAWLEADIDWR